LAGLLAATAIGVTAVPAYAAYAGSTRIDLRLLVVTNGMPNVEAIAAQLDREGVPYDLVDTRKSDRPVVTDSMLSDTVSGMPHARYQAVVLPDELALPAAELATLATFEQRFGVRQVDAYTWAHPEVGLNYATYVGPVDGLTATVTPAGNADGYGYLAGSMRFDNISPTVDEGYGYLATPATLPAGSSFTPLLTASAPGAPAPGSVMGVYAHDNREELVVTVSMNQFQTHGKVLAHGIIEWLTRGVHLGYWRNWFSVHVDDLFLPDDRWDTAANCTVGDDCNPTRDPAQQPYNSLIRMTPSDVDQMLAWQQSSGLKLDMAFNGGGSVEAGATDPLTTKVVANRNQIRFINHTYQHPYLGCVQDFTVVPWQCAKNPDGTTQWVSKADIQAQITQNVTWGRQNGLPLDATELITGEHSGLKSLPQMPADNPNLAPALTGAGIKHLASDASRESSSRIVGPSRTVPRYPMNIYYNVATAAEEVDEYNWIYTSKADGGSGICENNPTSTCITPLGGAAAFTSYIVPIESRIALGHVVSTDPRPHYAHQSNLTEDRILYPVLDSVLTQYRSTYATNTPLVNPRMSEISDQLRRSDAWRAAMAAKTVDAYLIDGRVTIVNKGASTVDVPASAPANTQVVMLSLLGLELAKGPYGQPYGPGRSAWTSASRNSQLLLRLPG
jgi:hypothetical protein